MKKTILFLIFTILISVAYGQKRGKIKWLSVSLKGGYGNSILINSDVKDDTGVVPDFLTPSSEFGGQLGITHGDNIGFFFEVLSSSFGQNYDIATTPQYTKKVNLKSLDYLITFRYTSDYGFYFEAGPKMTNVKSVSEENSIKASFNDVENISENYEEKFNSIVLGIGFALSRTDRLNFNLGLRWNYGFNSIILDENYYVMNDGVFKYSYIPSAKTKPFSMKLVLEIKYFFGFWGNASCGRGRFMLFQ